MKYARGTANLPDSFAPMMRCSSAGRTRILHPRVASNLKLVPAKPAWRSEKRLLGPSPGRPAAWRVKAILADFQLPTPCRPGLTKSGELTYHPPALYDQILSRGVYEISDACSNRVYSPVREQQRTTQRRGLQWRWKGWPNVTGSHGSARRPSQPSTPGSREPTAAAREPTGLSTWATQRAHG